MASEKEIERMVVRLVGDASKYQKMLKEAQESGKKAADKLEKAGTRMEKVQKRLEKAGMAMTAVGKKMSMMITAPIAAAAALGTRASMGFETSLQRLNSLVGMSAEEIAGFRKQILELAPAVGKGPTELAKALEAITSGGLRGEEAMEALTIAAKGSAIGMGDVAVIGRTASLAMTAYGEENLNAVEATDTMRAAAELGNAEAAQFAPVFGRTLPWAKKLGLEFEEIAGAMGHMTRVTGDASSAATGLVGMMAKLMGSGLAKPIQDALEKEEISLKSIQEVFADKGLSAGLINLEKQLASVGFTMQEFFMDREAVSAMWGMTGENAEGLAIGLAKVAAGAGGVNKKFQGLADLMGFKLAQQASRTKVMLIELGDVLAPVMKGMLDTAEIAMAAWNKLSTSMKSVVAGVAGVLAAIGPMLLIGGKLVGVLASLAKGYIFLNTWMITSHATMISWTTVAIGANVATGALAIGLGALAIWLYKTNTDVKAFNKSLETSARIQREVGSFQSGVQQRGMMEISSIKDPAKRTEALRKELAKQQKLASDQKQWASINRARAADETRKAKMPKGGSMIVNPFKGALVDLFGSGLAKLSTEAAEGNEKKASEAQQQVRTIQALIKQAEIEAKKMAEIEKVVTDTTPTKKDVAEENLKEALEATTSSLKQQIATFNMSAAATERWKLALAGATKEQLTQISLRQQIIEGLKTTKRLMEEDDEAYQGRIDSAKEIMKEYATPETKYKERMKELQGYLDLMGEKFQSTYDRAAKAAKKSLDDALDTATKDRTVRITLSYNYSGVQADEAGSVAAASFRKGYLKSIKTPSGGGLPKPAQISPETGGVRMPTFEAPKGARIPPPGIIPDDLPAAWGLGGMSGLNVGGLRTPEMGDLFDTPEVVGASTTSEPTRVQLVEEDRKLLERVAIATEGTEVNVESEVVELD